MLSRGDKTEQPHEPRPARSADKRQANRLLLIGAGIFLLLLVFGLAIQRMVPAPLALTVSQQLPRSADAAENFMTDGDRPLDDEPVRWVLESEQGTGRAFSFSFAEGGRPGESGDIPLPAGTAPVTRDVTEWRPWRSPALFSFEQLPKEIAIRAQPTDAGEGAPIRFRAPVPLPRSGAERDLMLATWEGTKPDLFVITRRQTSWPQLQILTGESRFREQVFSTRLPSHDLEPDEWSMDVGEVVGLPKLDDNRSTPGTRPDILLVHHDPAKEHSDILLLLGEAGYQLNAFRRDIDAPGALPPETEFLIGSRRGGPALYEITPQTEGGRAFQVFGIGTPAASK